jgi:hypothetical protein
MSVSKGLTAKGVSSLEAVLCSIAFPADLECN